MVKQLKGAPGRLAQCRSEARAFQPDHVERHDAVEARGDRKRGHVLADARQALQDRQLAHARKLMDDGTAAQKGAVAHPGVPAQKHVVSQDGLITDLTVATGLRLAAVLQGELAERYTVIPVTSRLCPHDKRLAENRVRTLLEKGAGDILLVATSCVEAGWDVSFAWPAREHAWIASALQTAGRVNRHGERSQGAPVYVFELADPLARVNPEQGPQLACMESIWARNRRLHAGLVTEATRALLEYDPKLLAKAKGLALALRTGDQKHLEAHTRLIQRSRQRCIATVRHLPEDVQRKLKAKPGTVVLAPEALAGLEAYGVDVRRSVFEKSPWKFDVKVINGQTYYLLREAFYDPAKGGAQLD